jgi:hypothetical protein
MTACGFHTLDLHRFEYLFSSLERPPVFKKKNCFFLFWGTWHFLNIAVAMPQSVQDVQRGWQNKMVNDPERARLACPVRVPAVEALRWFGW